MADEPSLRELKSLIERNHADVREDYLDLKTQMVRSVEQTDARFKEYVLREVFDAREKSMLLRIGSLEDMAKTSRAQVRGAIMAAAGSVIATIIAAVILSVILGGKP